MNTHYELSDVRVYESPIDGPFLKTEGDATSVMSEAFSAGATVTVIPAARFDPEFFRLRTGLLGQFVQKFVNYSMRLVILGNIDEQVNASTALRDFVRESNRGSHIWFVATREELAARLAAR
jgi:hypothetical protein